MKKCYSQYREGSNVIGQLFVNFCIMMTLTMIGSTLVNAQPDPPTDWRRPAQWATSIAAGVILLQFPVRLPDGVLIAVHGVAPALSGLYGGPVWGLATAFPIALYRFALGGAGGLPGMSHILTAGGVAGFLALGGRGLTLPLRNIVWRAMLVFVLANTTLLLIPAIGGEIFQEYFLLITATHSAGLVLVCWVMRTRFMAQRHLQLMTDLSRTDHLTGLANSRSFEESLGRLNASETGSFLLLDVDHFKQVNDRFGHLNGDEVLRAVAGTRLSTMSLPDQIWGDPAGVSPLVLLSPRGQAPWDS